MSNQTARDKHGRQRFHGAFTGGFSAGYHNTVGSIGGFQPKSFTSSRTRNDDKSKFSHHAEDYMDEEDFGEFGIAPKKIRVSSNYSDPHSNPKNNSSLRVKPPSSADSIGEKILIHSTKPILLRKNDVDSVVEVLNRYLRIDSNNFHGLGYKPLKVHCYSSKNSSKDTNFLNPLTATLKDGQRLKISGEAFGSGIQDDDDEELDHFDTYGYDSKNLYEFKKEQRPIQCTHNQDYTRTSALYEDGALAGFSLAKRNNVMEICDTSISDYKPPFIPDSWIKPVRKFELKRDDIRETNLKELKLEKIDIKFTSASSSQSNDTECKAGLISYSELKAVDTKQSEKNTTTSHEKLEIPFMNRQELDWFPCGILCKHFNVPNPHPLGAGPQPTCSAREDLEDTVAEKSYDTTINMGPVPLELRKLVFNVTFVRQEDLVDLEEECLEHEDTPQVELESAHAHVLGSTEKLSNSPKQLVTPLELDSSDSVSDIIVVESVAKEPEVILISSSSSRSSSYEPDHGSETSQKRMEDLYGPPAPPSLRSSQSYSRKKKKKKKKKDKKRKRSKRR